MYRQQPVRSHVVDMALLLFDEDGVDSMTLVAQELTHSLTMTADTTLIK